MLKVMNEANVAYLLGYLAGDGNYSNGWGKRKDRLSVTTTDVEVVEWFDANVIDFTMHNPKLNNNVERGIFAKHVSFVKTFPVAWSDFFVKHGLMSKKQDRAIRGVKKQHMKYFLLGLLDADGCITWSERKDRDRVTGKVMFAHPSEKLLGQVQTFLMDELKIPSAIKPKTGENCLMLSFSCIDHILKFCEYVYSDFVVLSRKKEKYLELKGEIESRREEGTSFPREFMLSWEYRSLIGSFSKKMYCVDGVEYPSLVLAAAATGIEKRTLHRRCQQGDKGCSQRPKTESEIKDQNKYVAKRSKELFKIWCEAEGI